MQAISATVLVADKCHSNSLYQMCNRKAFDLLMTKDIIQSHVHFPVHLGDFHVMEHI